MAEAIGVVGSVITIADLSYKSSKKLYEAVKKYKNAPKTLIDLRTDLDIVQRLLLSVQTSLAKTKEEVLPEALQQCLQDFEPSLKSLRTGCEQFEERLEKLTNHSTDSDMRRRDKLKLQFEEKSIEAFRFRLSSHKLSINIVLGLINCASSNQNRQVLDDLRKNITIAMNKISGQLEGLVITVETLGSSKGSILQGQVLKSLQDQEIALGHCLKLCTSAVEAAPSETKAAIEVMESLQRANQLVILTKGGERLVGTISAQGDSSQMFLDTTTGDGVRDVLGNFFNKGARTT